MIYCIDTSSILHAWLEAYPPKNFPPVWEKLDGLIAASRLFSSDEVLRELKRKHEPAHAWTLQRAQIFLPIDNEIQALVIKILEKYPRLVDTRKGRDSADPFVIAIAKIKNYKVVTNESFTNKLAAPNIPDVCKDMGIDSINILQLIEDEEWIIGGS